MATAGAVMVPVGGLQAATGFFLAIGARGDPEVPMDGGQRKLARLGSGLALAGLAEAEIAAGAMFVGGLLDRRQLVRYDLAGGGPVLGVRGRGLEGWVGAALWVGGHASMGLALGGDARASAIPGTLILGGYALGVLQVVENAIAWRKDAPITTARPFPVLAFRF